jgi:hypothetical protein
MISSDITYNYALNVGSVSLITFDKEDFVLSVKGYMGEPELEFISKSELIELGEWFIALGKGKE